MLLLILDSASLPATPARGLFGASANLGDSLANAFGGLLGGQ